MINLKARKEEAKSSDFVLYLTIPPERGQSRGPARYAMGWYATEKQAAKMQRLSQLRSGRAFIVVKEERL